MELPIAKYSGPEQRRAATAVFYGVYVLQLNTLSFEGAR